MTQVGTDRQLYRVDTTGPYELEVDNTLSHVRPRRHWTFLLDEEGTTPRLGVVTVVFVLLVVMIGSRALSSKGPGYIMYQADRMCGALLVLTFAVALVIRTVNEARGWLDKRRKSAGGDGEVGVESETMRN